MRILVISDLHAPFNHPAALDFLAGLRRQYKPQEVVCVGDEIDGHGWGRWDRNPDSPGQGEELAQAIDTMHELYKIFPRVKVCRSNHGDRAFKTAARAGLPGAFIRGQREVLEAPVGWQWAEHWIVDGVAFIHGEGFSGQNSALNACQKHRCPTVIGHVHSWAAVQYHSNAFSTIWGMNVGCLVDPSSLAMQYAKNGPNKQVLGTGIVLDGVPFFIPLVP